MYYHPLLDQGIDPSDDDYRRPQAEPCQHMEVA